MSVSMLLRQSCPTRWLPVLEWGGVGDEKTHWYAAQKRLPSLRIGLYGQLHQIVCLWSQGISPQSQHCQQQQARSHADKLRDGTRPEGGDATDTPCTHGHFVTFATLCRVLAARSVVQNVGIAPLPFVIDPPGRRCPDARRIKQHYYCALHV